MKNDMLNTIYKSGGHCYNGVGWTFCEFFSIRKKSRYNFCKLYNALLEGSKSVDICNSIHGVHCENKRV